MDENGHRGVRVTRRTVLESGTVTAAFLLSGLPQVALSAEAADTETAVQPGMRYRHMMSPNHLVDRKSVV